MTAPTPAQSDGTRQQALMFLRDKVINDAMPPVRKQIAGEWLLHRDRVLIDKLVAKHLPELLKLIAAEKARIFEAVEEAIGFTSEGRANITGNELIMDLRAEIKRLREGI